MDVRAIDLQPPHINTRSHFCLCLKILSQASTDIVNSRELLDKWPWNSDLEPKSDADLKKMEKAGVDDFYITVECGSNNV